MKQRTTYCQGVIGQDAHKSMQTVSGSPISRKEATQIHILLFSKDHTGPVFTTFLLCNNCVGIQFSIPSISSNNLQLYKNLLSVDFANFGAMNYERINGINISIYSAVGENKCRIRLQSSDLSISYLEGSSGLRPFLIFKKEFSSPYRGIEWLVIGNGKISCILTLDENSLWIMSPIIEVHPVYDPNNNF